MADVPYRTLRAEDALRDMTHHLTQATHHANKAHEAHRLYLSLLPGGENRALPGLSEGRRRSAPGCVAAWTEYLQEHGPSLRQEVQDGTGVKFSERAYPYTIVWEDGMENHGDDEFMGDAIVRIRTPKVGGGRGGSPVAFFLWSQRYEVFDRFGVGPTERPEPETAETLLGVVHPPTESQSYEIQEAAEAESTEEDSIRFASMDEWYDHWVPVFDMLAPYGEPPTKEEKEEMVATMPEDTNGEPVPTILARCFYEAKERLQ